MQEMLSSAIDGGLQRYIRVYDICSWFARGSDGGGEELWRRKSEEMTAAAAAYSTEGAKLPPPTTIACNYHYTEI